jgi:hypothetical protein
MAQVDIFTDPKPLAVITDSVWFREAKKVFNSQLWVHGEASNV